MHQNVHCCSCLVSNPTIFSAHFKSLQQKQQAKAFTTQDCAWKIRDRYQAYYTTYKTPAMATHHGGTGCPVDRDIDLHTEDMEGINTEPDNNNKSTSDSDTTVAFGGSETDGHHGGLIPNNQAKLTALMRELHNLH